MKLAQKIFSVIIALIISATFLSTAAFADMGPKPSLEVRFRGVNGENCWAALLLPENNLGPGNEPWFANEKSTAEQITMNGYKDDDGFIMSMYQGSPEKIDQNSALRHSYYPPDNFKVLLYFPDSGEFFVTPVYERYAFRSYFTIDVSTRQNGTVTAISSYYLAKEIVFLIIRILLTIGIELLIALAFKFTAKKQILFIAIVNIITQIALNIGINMIYFKMGATLIFLYIPLEFAVFAVETILYAALLKTPEGKPVKGGKAVGYAAAANAVSFIFGVVVFWISEIIARI
ncbi:MAG: hypothetical protein ACI4JT_01610 [Oscillospiraceae bacterium]